MRARTASHAASCASDTGQGGFPLARGSPPGAKGAPPPALPRTNSAEPTPAVGAARSEPPTATPAPSSAVTSAAGACAGSAQISHAGLERARSRLRSWRRASRVPTGSPGAAGRRTSRSVVGGPGTPTGSAHASSNPNGVASAPRPVRTERDTQMLSARATETVRCAASRDDAHGSGASFARRA